MRTKYFNKLNYSLGDEDSIIEYEILPFGCKNVFAIAGSGGRVLPLLARQPASLSCIDILEEQLFLTELRIESIRTLGYENFCAFWGYPPFEISPVERQEIFEKIDLSVNAKKYLRAFFSKNKWSKIIYMGKFEKMLSQLSAINKLITGKRGQKIFLTNTLDEQTLYFRRQFPHFQWKIVLSLLGNSTVLNSILYKGDFPKKNIAGSTYKNFERIFNSIFFTIPVKDSFFAQMAFFGKIKFPSGNLLEANREYFYKIKEGAEKTRINYIQGDIISIIKQNKEIDFVSLSDVPSFINGEIEKTYLQEIKESLTKNCLVIVRGNLRVTTPDYANYELMDESFNNVFKKETTQLWKTNVYRRN